MNTKIDPTEATDLIVEEHGRVLVLTMNRPQVKNAMSQTLAHSIAEAIDGFEKRADLSVAVITGAGGNFCSGMDLKGFARGERPVVEGRGFAGLVKSPPSKPIIAAIEGYALAGGFEITLACDLLVASTTAQFGLPEVKRGLTAAAGGLLRLPSRVSLNIAMDLVLTGRMWSAEEAYDAGLVSRLTAPGTALDAALKLAEEIAKNAPLALAASKRVLKESTDWSITEQFDRQESIVSPVRDSEDAREGARAFVEKREPNWIGR